MDKRIVIGGGVVALALVLLGIRLASNSGAKSGLDTALAHLPPGYTATHGAVTYSALTGQARVRDLALFRNGAPLFAAGDVLVSGIGAQDATGTPRRIGEIIMHDASGGSYRHIARIDLSGIYPATLRDVFDPAAYPGGRPAWTDKRLVLEHGEIDGMEAGQAGIKGAQGAPVDVTFGIGRITADGTRLSQLASPPDLAAPSPLLIVAVEARMSQDSGALKDMTVAVNGPTPVHVTLSRAGGTKYDGGRFDEFSMQDLTMRTDKPAGSVAIGGLSAKGYDISNLLAMMPIIAADPGKPHPEVLNGLHLDSGEIHGLRVDYPEGPLITMDKLSVYAAPGGPPDAGRAVMTALTIKTSGRPVSPAVRAQLDSFGMADFTTDLNEEGGYDRNAGQLTIRRFDVTIHDLGTLHATMNIAGLPSAPAATPEQMQQAAAAARLTDASLVWDNTSLTQRLLKMTAAKQGVTPDQVRMGLALPLASLAILMPDQPDAAAQVTAFLDGQHQLSITAKPSVPVGIVQWEATPVPQRAALLGLRVSGN